MRSWTTLSHIRRPSADDSSEMKRCLWRNTWFAVEGPYWVVKQISPYILSLLTRVSGEGVLLISLDINHEIFGLHCRTFGCRCAPAVACWRRGVHLKRNNPCKPEASGTRTHTQNLRGGGVRAGILRGAPRVETQCSHVWCRAGVISLEICVSLETFLRFAEQHRFRSIHSLISLTNERCARDIRKCCFEIHMSLEIF